MASIIDIHPHVIAPDTVRYPLNPLGGHQSDWSRERPVPTRDMVAAMDEAGVDKAAHRAGLDLLRPRQHLCGRGGRRASRALHRRVLGRRAGARRGGEDPPLDAPQADRAAPVHHRQHHAGPGHLVRRSADLSGLGVCRRGRPAGLHADDAARLSAAARADGAVPEGADHPRPPGAAGARRRPALRGGSRASSPSPRTRTCT